MSKEEAIEAYKRELEARFRPAWTIYEEILSNLLMNSDPRDDAAFHDILMYALDIPITFEIEIAHKFNCSLTTVRRWKSRISAPFFTVRPMIYEYLKEELVKGPYPRPYISVTAIEAKTDDK